MAEQDKYITEGEGDHISKLAFTAVAAPGPESSSASTPHEIHDLDQYTPVGAPATKKEVYSYYLYYAGNNGIGSFQ
tara:strand:- start:1090 stop:1317 length:228 start_codon:yes stop_codon:yes gene_type:complete